MNAHAAIGPVQTAGGEFSPKLPNCIGDLGLDEDFLTDLLVKTVFRLGLEHVREVAWAMRLQAGVANELVARGQKLELLEPVLKLGVDAGAEPCFLLSEKGHARALEAFNRSQYSGPVPVTLAEFARQVETQSIRKERLTSDELNEAFASLTLSRTLLDKLGLAANCAPAILLYGPPGNGKSSIARAIGGAFDDTIYIPHAMVVGKQVIAVFDPTIHSPVEGGNRLPCARAVPCVAPPYDPRFVACRRPTLAVGSELTLDRFDPTLNEDYGIYEAPLHLKAAGGVLVVDDLGRQCVSAEDLIDRLVSPIESGVDEFVLHTGRRFQAPFDALVIFATNLAPSQLAGNAALRHLRHKVFVERPDSDTYIKLFNRIARERGLKASRGIMAYLLDELYGGTAGAELEAFHPRFLLDHVSSMAAYKGSAGRLNREALRTAWENLYAVEEPACPASPIRAVPLQPSNGASIARH